MVDYKTLARQLVARRQVRPVKWAIRCARNCGQELTIEYTRVVISNWDAREDLAEQAIDKGWDIGIRGLLCPACYRLLEGFDDPQQEQGADRGDGDPAEDGA